ncbi:MAG: 2-C-methyl-D-erythritol 2,4-cyclodiphosphate synthase [Candidatus Delongbacteria bacterium]|nr:2-C-methyl-D-erythritol 2,4-cyclodiphosphate synthase [Candidatus Delongbacteria bacterium]
MRIGCGFDVHRLVPDRPLILGGVQIPYELGLAGHSDADVLLHAICDALLGALALGDIGQHFPDDDPRYSGCDSRELLKQVFQLIQERGYRLGNLDATLVLQQPRVAPFLPAMREQIAPLLDTPLENVSLKATTSEQLGFTGRGEGIAAQAVVLLLAQT